MFCPKCGAEYRPGFTHCPDCDVDLVYSLPVDDEKLPNKQLDNTELVPILSTHDMTDVINIKSLLDSEGVEYLMRGEEFIYLERVDPVILCVKPEDVEHVKELLKNIKLNYYRFVYNKKQYE